MSYLHIIFYVSEDGRLHEVALVTNTSSTGGESGTLFLSGGDVAENLVELILVDLRTLASVGVHRVTDNTFLGQLGAALNDFSIDLLFYKHTRAGNAALALVQEQSQVSLLHGVFNVRIGEDDVRRFTTKFECDAC